MVKRAVLAQSILCSRYDGRVKRTATQRIFDGLWALATRVTVFALEQKKETLQASKGELERQLEEELAAAIGIPKSNVHIEYFICEDGRVVPTVSFDCPLSKTQQQWASVVLDSQSDVKQNMKANHTLN